MIRGTFGFQILDRITKSVDTAIRHYFSEYMMIEGRSFGYVDMHMYSSTNGSMDRK